MERATPSQQQGTAQGAAAPSHGRRDALLEKLLARIAAEDRVAAQDERDARQRSSPTGIEDHEDLFECEDDGAARPRALSSAYAYRGVMRRKLLNDMARRESDWFGDLHAGPAVPLTLQPCRPAVTSPSRTLPMRVERQNSGNKAPSKPSKVKITIKRGFTASRLGAVQVSPETWRLEAADAAALAALERQDTSDDNLDDGGVGLVETPVQSVSPAVAVVPAGKLEVKTSSVGTGEGCAAAVVVGEGSVNVLDAPRVTNEAKNAAIEPPAEASKDLSEKVVIPLAEAVKAESTDAARSDKVQVGQDDVVGVETTSIVEEASEKMGDAAVVESEKGASAVAEGLLVETSVASQSQCSADRPTRPSCKSPAAASSPRGSRVTTRVA